MWLDRISFSEFKISFKVQQSKMFSAIKKAFGRDDESGKNGTIGNRSEPPGIQQMDTSLQRRFARGIQYNSKKINL